MKLKPIHDVELNLLETFIMLCHQYSLSYFLIGGSLLGSIRHQGFIPWDDDLDIGMPRKDYNQLLKVAPTTLSHTSYFLQTPYTDRNYGLSYAKLLDLDTNIQEINNINNAKKGIFIDIFPFDAISPTSSERTAQMTKFKFYDSSIILRLGYHLIDNPLRKMIRPLSTKQYNEVRQLKHKRDDIMQQFSDTHTTEFKNLASQYKYDREIMTATELTTITTHPFEHLNVCIPQYYDQILTRMYGDYMQLPPKNERVQKHFKEITINGESIE
ncbi:LicD family protein [Paucilactobacillus kaifaensis]|uniref:LicD family protein n=1 Tax=Paucilactobacillus kaifaensis TaxID=2559921 RepID=UPI0010F50A7D|nr:LicD family protein [Paucilactobacillus kaifaensis]